MGKNGVKLQEHYMCIGNVQQITRIFTQNEKGMVLRLDFATDPFSRCNKLKPNGFLNATND